MPQTPPTNFNTTGFARRPPENLTGYSLLPTSPYRSDGEVWTLQARITPDAAMPHMGWVHTARQYSHRIRIACEHWAPGEASEDCRFGCEARAQQRAFTP